MIPEQLSTAGTRRGVGRPRDRHLDPVIRAATLKLLSQAGGASSFTLDHLAVRAGVGKATIYRRWSSKTDLILDAVRSGLPVVFDTVDRGSVISDAAALLASLGQVLTGSQGMAARQLLPQLSTWPELADTYRDGALAPWHDARDAVVSRAGQRGDVCDLDGARTALHAAGSALVAQWMVYPPTIHPDGAAQSMADQLVATLIRPLV